MTVFDVVKEEKIYHFIYIVYNIICMFVRFLEHNIFDVNWMVQVFINEGHTHISVRPLVKNQIMSFSCITLRWISL